MRMLKTKRSLEEITSMIKKKAEREQSAVEGPMTIQKKDHDIHQDQGRKRNKARVIQLNFQKRIKKKQATTLNNYKIKIPTQIPPCQRQQR